jgi:phage baseplate assembly protein V
MSIKRLLSDTDSQRGLDARFATAVVIGKVSQIECDDKRANVRVLLPDRLDHEGTPLNTKPIPVLQVASQAKRSYAIPRINDQVVLIKLANGTSDYLVVGSFYTTSNKPPVSDPMLDHVEYDDGSTMQFNASTGELTWKLKGNMLWDNEKDFTFKTKGNILIEIDGDITAKPQGNIDVQAGGDIDIKSDGDTVIEAANITLRGNITLDGLVHTTANMNTDGVHRDSIGYHTGATIGNSAEWKWTTSLVDAVNAGQSGINTTAWATATQTNLSMMTNDGRDMTALISSIAPGNELRLQAKADSTRFGLYKVMTAPVPHGGWWSVGVAVMDSNGAPPSNNTVTIVTLIQPATSGALMQRLAAMEQRIADLEART